jgi:hypothetical protein
MKSMTKLLVLTGLFLCPTIVRGDDPPKSDAPAKPTSESPAAKPEQKSEGPAKAKENSAAPDKAR